MKRLLAILSIIGLTAATPLVASDKASEGKKGMERAVGYVTTVEDDRFSLKTHEGEVMEFEINRELNAQELADLRTGHRVQVWYESSERHRATGISKSETSDTDEKGDLERAYGLVTEVHDDYFVLRTLEGAELTMDFDAQLDGEERADVQTGERIQVWYETDVRHEMKSVSADESS